MAGNNACGIILQARDYAWLRALAIMRVADREQLKIIGGVSATTTINLRLHKLVRHGFLNVFFMGSVANGRKAMYTLTSKSARLIGAEKSILRRSYKTTIAGDLFLSHQEHLNDVYLWLCYHPKPAGATIALARWEIQLTPLAERSRIIPDAYFELQVDGVIRPGFLEIDMGTEKHDVVMAKCRAYIQFATSGEFRRRFGHEQFRVFVVSTSGKRIRALTEEIAKITTKIFWLTDFEAINRDGFWWRVWRRPGVPEPLSLI